MTHDELSGIAVRVLAQQCARKTIKEQLRAQGVKLSYVPMREIISQAKAWLREHPEMIAEARAKAASLGYIADQGPPTHSHSKGTAEPQIPTQIRLPLLRKGACGIADRGDGTMHEEEVCNFNFDDVLEPPANGRMWFATPTLAKCWQERKRLSKQGRIGQRTSPSIAFD